MRVTLSAETAVRDRYSKAARAREASLCCPVDYDPRYLEVIPKEVLELDYGCGDPSRYLKRGETVLDLGCGAGKICFIAAQIVGPTGRVIGVDMTQEMLEVARRNADIVQNRLGYANTEFKRAFIQDLSLDLDALEEYLVENPVQSAQDYLNLRELATELKRTRPLIPTESIDIIVSNCVLNLVDMACRADLFSEIHRVLKPGGRVVISDIVSNRPVSEEMRGNPNLWSGCISGAMTEAAFLSAFEAIGFQSMTIVERQSDPWQVFEGIEFRSITIEAYRPSLKECSDSSYPVIYKGPFKQVLDDDGHRISRGEQFNVCDKTYTLYTQSSYREHFLFPEQTGNGNTSCLEDGACCSPGHDNS